MSVPFMRPVREEDFTQIHALAQQTGGGMTNLPMEEKALRARIDFTLESFATLASKPGGEVYMLVLEKDGAVIGTSAIFSAIGLQSGFVNYRINTMFHFSEQLGKRVSRRLLVPTHDFTGMAEVGSLFISPNARGGGYGKLLARSRYMFIAQSPHLIAERICAELRGWRDDKGGQPFWEAIGQHFFDMDFEAADQHNSVAGNQFISDLMPIYPIYIALLPATARKAIGKPHKNAQPAFNMLEAEGFEYRGYVDIFDGGPVLDAKTTDLRAVHDSMEYKVRIIDQLPDPQAAHDMMLATGAHKDFRCVRARVHIDNDYIYLDPDIAKALEIDHGVRVRATAW